jgi:hypothetical protein
MAKVEIPRGMLIGLAGVAAAAVLGLVFVLGRESGRNARKGPGKEPGSPVVSAAASSPPGIAVASGAPPESPTPAMIPAEGEPSSAAPGRPSPSGPLGTPAPATSGSATAATDSLRAEVGSYFQAVERIHPASGGDPEALAQQVVAGLGKGDMTGFEALIQEAQAARNRLSALTPPQPCAAYHRESLASLDAGLDLMRAMKKALSSSEPGSLDLESQANALKARSEALQLQEKALKQRFALVK